MSYQEVLTLIEYLKILGYPRHLKINDLYTTQGSLENFKLVFDILRWLIDQYEPGAVILGGVDSEIDRILLVRSVVEFLVVKTGIKLNPLRLYASSMVTAGELLKVVNLVMKRPVDLLQDTNNTNNGQYRKLGDLDIDDKVKARQRGRELASELTQIGAALYDLLGKEAEHQEKRNIQAGRQLEQSNADKILSGVVTSANLKLSGDKGQLDSALAERQAIAAKVDRKKADLERLKQRLDTLQKIRPAFSEEFERAEEELEKLFTQYFLHVRCLDALRAQTNVNAKSAQPLPDSMKSNAIDAPPSMILLPEGILDLSDDLSNDGNDLVDDRSELKLRRSSEVNIEKPHDEKNGENGVNKSKFRIRTGVGRSGEKHIVGNMAGTSAESDLDSSLDYNVDDDESDSELDLNDETLLSGTTNMEAIYNFNENAGSRKKSAKPKTYQSDEDF